MLDRILKVKMDSQDETQAVKAVLETVKILYGLLIPLQ